MSKDNKCDCQDVEMGSYDNQRFIPSPFHMPKENGYCIDTCLVEEILELWSYGIETTGCCCGHNKLWPYIGVIPDHEERMIDRGYKRQFNMSRNEDTGTFWPLSVDVDPNLILKFAYNREKNLKNEIKKMMRGKR